MLEVLNSLLIKVRDILRKLQYLINSFSKKAILCHRCTEVYRISSYKYIVNHKSLFMLYGYIYNTFKCAGILRILKTGNFITIKVRHILKTITLN